MSRRGKRRIPVTTILLAIAVVLLGGALGNTGGAPAVVLAIAVAIFGAIVQTYARPKRRRRR